ncbi:hypothetical protein NEOKW01_1285 [Nematocida sp. AWRm80]|nr:hypothetical protein NEOKW01_1285 [Nematocida sp. AWRm80]
MEVSPEIGRIAKKIKKYFTEQIELNSIDPREIQETIIKYISPLQDIFNGIHPEVFPEFLVDQGIEDPYVYRLITKHLCGKGATESARILLEEIEECLPMEDEYEKIDLYKIYNPWDQELSMPSTVPFSRRAITLQRIKDVKIACSQIITEHTQKKYFYEFSKIHAMVSEYLKYARTETHKEEVNKKLQQLIAKIRSICIRDKNTLIYTEGQIKPSLHNDTNTEEQEEQKETKEISSATASIYSLSSQKYRHILSILSLLVAPLREEDVKRASMEQKPLGTHKENGIPLDILYWTGKKMELININPYDNVSETIESAMPSILSFHSSFFCPVLRSECSIDNVPCILTCGHVISMRAIEKIALFKGTPFKCPYCPKDIHVKDILKLQLPI